MCSIASRLVVNSWDHLGVCAVLPVRHDLVLADLDDLAQQTGPN
jgi:hypothetical protein